MALKKVISVGDAVAIIHDGDVLATTGYGGNGTPGLRHGSRGVFRTAATGLTPLLAKCNVRTPTQESQE